MAHYVALSRTTHREAGLIPGGYQHALEETLVPVVTEELPQVIAAMPVGFAPKPSEQGYSLVAVQSLRSGVNAYVQPNGRWLGSYRPAWYRAHPFRLTSDAESGQRILCIDTDSPTYVPHAGANAIRLFEDDGTPTQHTQASLKLLEKLDAAQRVTQALVNELEAAGLITPWRIRVGGADDESAQPVTGIYRIDEAALKALDPETLGRLAASGALSAAYAQLLSEHRLQTLARLHQRRDGVSRNETGSSQDVDLESLFRDDDDDLSFAF
ncbi:SapC family protein [Vreelandella utahensis]|uniref:SapC family protein n=1 Tax=Vreelandella halophila TaxID=86177 RepID=UPI0009850853|nr:SapC family protein [Halomonas utahensis]